MLSKSTDEQITIYVKNAVLANSSKKIVKSKGCDPMANKSVSEEHTPQENLDNSYNNTRILNFTSISHHL